MSTIQTLQLQLLAALEKLLANYKAAIVPPIQTPAAAAIYAEAASCLGKPITLDSTVPPDLGCAEAVTYVLKNASIAGIPATGIPGTAALYAWLNTNPEFVLTTTPRAGDVVISPTGTSTISSPHGHTGIVANYGILSNDSDTGLFLEKYTQATWQQYFNGVEGFPVYYFHHL